MLCKCGKDVKYPKIGLCSSCYVRKWYLKRHKLDKLKRHPDNASTAIEKARRAVYLTQVKAAEEVGVTGRYFGFVETGHRSASERLRERIAALFGVTMDELFDEDGQVRRLY